MRGGKGEDERGEGRKGEERRGEERRGEDEGEGRRIKKKVLFC